MMRCDCGREMVETPDSQVFFSKCPEFGGLGEHCIVVRAVPEKVEINFKITPDEPAREVSPEEFMDTIKREGGQYEPH